jgi:pimeloyl-ACP methyl ester carboxylesterase
VRVVLVHGVPETPAVWGPSAPSGCRRPPASRIWLPRPKGFGATKEEYVDWLVGELDRLHADGPSIWWAMTGAAGLVVRVVSTRPDLVRSWVTDAASVGDADFEWHEFTRIWQTPGAGEDFFERRLARPVAKRGVFEQFGVPHHQAVAMTGLDPTMAECILALYRSAVDVGREWAPDFRDVPAPGLVVVPSEDPFLSADSARNAATRAKASVAELAGLGHWWMLQDPAQAPCSDIDPTRLPRLPGTGLDDPGSW